MAITAIMDARNPRFQCTTTSVGSKVGLDVNLVSGSAGTPSLQSSNFTRPSDTTAYALGDLMANSTTAGSVTPLSFAAATAAGFIRRVRLLKSNATGNLDVRVHFFTSAPTVANGDNGVYSPTGAASYIGSVSIAARTLFTDGGFGVGVPDMGFEIPVSAGQTLYALTEMRAAYTPASGETITITLEILQ